jgi:hypothetical protein
MASRPQNELDILHEPLWKAKEPNILSGAFSSVFARFFVGGVKDFIRNAQPFHRSAVENVRLDDFVHVLRTDAAVEHTLRINGDCGAQFTLIEAAGFVRADQSDAALRQFQLEEPLQFALPGRSLSDGRLRADSYR